MRLQETPTQQPMPQQMIDAPMLPRAALFDMDGTLTAPLLNFAQIKVEMGCGPGPILESLATLDDAAKQLAMEVLLRHESLAADQSTLNPGCEMLLNWLVERGVRIAVITRNSRKSAQTVLNRHHLPHDILLTREDCPFKPDPEPLRRACRQLNVDPLSAWMIGDGAFDVQAGIAAEINTVWISHDRSPEFAEMPWRTVRDLGELHKLFQMCRA